MKVRPWIGAFLALSALVLSAEASTPLGLNPASHEEIAGTLDELTSQLSGFVARFREHFSAGPPRAVRPLITLMLRHRDALGLSPDQVQTLERLRTDFQREAVRRAADLRVAEFDLAALVDADPVDLGEVEAKLREIERLRTDLTLARIRTIEKGKAQLTPEQRTRLRSLLTEPRPPHPRADTSRPPGRERL